MTRKNKRNKTPPSAKDDAPVKAGNLTAKFGSAHSPFLVPIIFTVFVFVFGLISVTSFQQKSPTVDEPVHVLSGYSYLKWGDFRANPEHPPLAKMWAALPLMFLDIKDPRSTSSEWDRIPSASPRALHTVNVAGRMLFVDNDAENLFFYAKIMMIGMAIMLGFFVFHWSRELFGGGAAVVSLFIYVLDPNFLAHSQLVHTDLSFTAFFFIATYFFCRALNRLSIANVILTAGFFGLASITKYAYMAIILVWVVLGAIIILTSPSQELAIGKPTTVTGRWRRLALLGGVFASTFVTAYFFIWAVYGFSFDAIPGGKLHLPIAEELPRSPTARTLVSYLIHHHLFPEAWLYGQLHVFNNLARDTYLFGKMFLGEGNWLYFPVALAVKTPLPTLLMLLATPVIWALARVQRKREWILLIPVAVYFTLAVWSGINIGLRHLLPIYPFLFVILGGTALTLWEGGSRIHRRGLVFLAVWYFLSAVFTYPSYLTFFNEGAGGSKNGHKILLDSNLDWGQDLKGLKAWMVGRGIENIEFLYFGFFNAAAPRYYGINAMFLPGSWVDAREISRAATSKLDFIAISANHLYGHFIGGADEEFVKPFRVINPIEVIGHSIAVYDYEDAIRQYRNIVRASGASAEPHYYLANLLSRRGISYEAAQEYRAAIRLDPDFTEARNSLGLVLLRSGALEEAIEQLRKVLTLKPIRNRHETQFHLGAALAKQGRFTEAAVYLNDALKSQPGFAPAYYNLGMLSAAEGKLDRAIEYFRETLAVDPQNADAHGSLARALMEQGKREEASKHYQEAIRILRTQRGSVAPTSPGPNS